jgi:hypothetical protein
MSARKYGAAVGTPTLTKNSTYFFLFILTKFWAYV